MTDHVGDLFGVHSWRDMVVQTTAVNIFDQFSVGRFFQLAVERVLFLKPLQIGGRDVLIKVVCAGGQDVDAVARRLLRDVAIELGIKEDRTESEEHPFGRVLILRHLGSVLRCTDNSQRKRFWGALQQIFLCSQGAVRAIVDPKQFHVFANRSQRFCVDPFRVSQNAFHDVAYFQ